MDQYVIRGGRPLRGEVTISGAKNAAVAIIPAALLVDGICRIENIPRISDTDNMLSILNQMGAIVRLINKNTVEIDCRPVRTHIPPVETARRMRASYYLLGALLGRCHKAQVAMPGGCYLGARPIDQHEKGFRMLGAQVSTIGGFIEAQADELIGAAIYLDVVSVGATINIMLAAVLAEGQTVIDNAAREPHIVDVANFLNAMGADVRGAGTDTIRIKGVPALRGGTYCIIPDQIEAGTYMAAAAATGGDVLIKGVIPKHMESVSAKLCEMGVEVIEMDDAIRVRRTRELTAVNIKTQPYPGFPTDMQPQMGVMLCIAKGTSIINESVWENRFRYTGELLRMGANIKVDGKVAVFEGVEKLTGASIKSCDLRAGAALVIAALMAEGTSYMEDIQYIERGYEDVVEKFRSLGADITRVSQPDPVEMLKAN